LQTYYQVDASRMSIYRSIASDILEDADAEGPVCLALYGHPLVLSTISTMVLDGADYLGLPAVVVPGISSFDTVLADLRLDPGGVGLQVQEATDLIVQRRELDPNRGLLLLQVPQVSSAVYSATQPSEGKLQELVQYLGRFYSPDQPVVMVRSSTDAGQVGIVRLTELQRLSVEVLDLPNDLTLYLPPVAVNPVARKLGDDALRPSKMAQSSEVPPDATKASNTTAVQVEVLTTGGTIDKGYEPSSASLVVGPSYLAEVSEQLRISINWSTRGILHKDSLDMDDSDRRALVAAILQSDVERILVTHGTDTISSSAEEVRASLSASADREKTVVFTGALVPGRFSPAEACFNLGAAFTAVQLMPPGVYVTIGGQVYRAGEVEKDQNSLRFLST
jgi:L-asparaginase